MLQGWAVALRPHTLQPFNKPYASLGWRGGGGIGLHVHLSAKQNRPRSPRESHYTCTTRAGGRERAEASANNFTDSSGEPLNFSEESLLRKRLQNKIPQQHTHTHTQRKIRHTLASSVADMALRSLRMFWILLKLLSRAIVSAFSFACDSLARSSSTSKVSALASPALRFASYGGGGAGGKGGAAALSVEVRSLCGRCTRSLFVRLLFWRVLGRGVC